MSEHTPIRRLQWQDLAHPVHFFALGFGSGLSPKAPGTMGTLMAVPFVLLWQMLPLWGFALVVLLSCVIGVWLCDVTARNLGVHDHPGIVWDEFAGYWLTMLFAPSGWLWLLLGFVLFRIFDILKPWPIGWVDRRVSGGFGIMLDDILAGIYAGLLLLLIHYGFIVFGG
jgi:phosphatidylglycerophosphatase A